MWDKIITPTYNYTMQECIVQHVGIEIECKNHQFFALKLKNTIISFSTNHGTK